MMDDTYLAAACGFLAGAATILIIVRVFVLLHKINCKVEGCHCR